MRKLRYLYSARVIKGVRVVERGHWESKVARDAAWVNRVVHLLEQRNLGPHAQIDAKNRDVRIIGKLGKFKVP